MSDYFTDKEAFIIAKSYGFNPTRKVGRYRSDNVDAGKYEPDHRLGEPLRSMVQASWLDKTNIIIQYAPADLIEPP